MSEEVQKDVLGYQYHTDEGGKTYRWKAGMEKWERIYTDRDVEEWRLADEAMRKAKDTEINLRLPLARWYFQNPREGTNNHTLENNFVLKMKHTIRRKVDEALLALFRKPERLEGEDESVEPKSKLERAGVDFATIFKAEYSLVVGEYRKLTEDQRKVVDQILIISDDSTPGLEYAPPAKRKQKD